MSEKDDSSQPYVLGIDLGSASLGWALIELDGAENSVGLLSGGKDRTRRVPPCGVRIFEPGVDGTALEIEQGKDQSKAVERRTARLHRRQLRRRAYRQSKLFLLLQEKGLLPSSGSEKKLDSSQERHAVLTRFDRELWEKWKTDSGTGDFAQLPLYCLRKAALDRKLDPPEIGRVLYHLSQRRGFKSNRKEGKKTADKEKEAGAVKAGIASLREKMDASGARTLGEYFAGLDPHQIDQNVRRRWTARAMYEEEFTSGLDAFLVFEEEERGFAPATIDRIRRCLSLFLNGVASKREKLSDIVPEDISHFIATMSAERRWKRTTVVAVVSALRTFFRFAQSRHWCASGLVDTIDAPRIYKLEGLPHGPQWSDVQRLLVGTSGNTPADIRDHAMLLLIAVYGLRSGEVRGLCLEDIDWEQESIRICRTKHHTTQRYPLVPALGEAILHYLREARPQCQRREVFARPADAAGRSRALLAAKRKLPREDAGLLRLPRRWRASTPRYPKLRRIGPVAGCRVW